MGLRLLDPSLFMRYAYVYPHIHPCIRYIKISCIRTYIHAYTHTYTYTQTCVNVYICTETERERERERERDCESKQEAFEPEKPGVELTAKGAKGLPGELIHCQTVVRSEMFVGSQSELLSQYVLQAHGGHTEAYVHPSEGTTAP